jgi:hypothetical protein
MYWIMLENTDTITVKTYSHSIPDSNCHVELASCRLAGCCSRQDADSTS